MLLYRKYHSGVKGEENRWGILGGGNIQIVAIKHVYVHFKCTASELHIMYII